MEIATAHSENRSFPRSPIRSTVTVITRAADGTLSARTCWTDDLSAGGARLLSAVKLETKILFLRILNPALKDKVFKASIIREDKVIIRELGLSTVLKRFPYGIRFEGICEDSEIRTVAGIELESSEAIVANC